MRRARRRNTGGLTGGIVLIGIILAILIHPFNLAIFFAALAVATFVGALSNPNPQRIYGAIFGSMWLLILAIFFVTHSWIWFLIGAAISALLGTFVRSIVAWIMANGAFGLAAQTPPPQQYYTPPQAPPPPQAQPPYQQGYQGPPAHQPETYREGEKQYYYPPQTQESSAQYDRPQSQYPQQMPPQ